MSTPLVTLTIVMPVPRKPGKGKKSLYPRTYYVWAKMLQRCHDKQNDDYHNYGARGLAVCDRWRESFNHFLADMGPQPENMTIERVNNDLGYTPDNCIWASRRDQNNNKRNTKWFTHEGRTMCLSDWAKEVGIAATSINARLRRGWTLDQAILAPKTPGRPQNQAKTTTFDEGD